MKRFFIIAVLLCAVPALAQAPRTMNFQGTLADGAGVTLPDGNYNLTFRLWNSDIGGAMLWTETISVSLNSGIFNTVLGESTALLLPFDQQYWLGIAVGADPELSPRSQLTGVPYAMNVADGAVVQSLNGRVDDLNIVGGANISVNVVGNDIIINGTGALSDADWNVVGNDMTSIPVGNVGIGQAAPATKLHVGGNATLGNSLLPGTLYAHNGTGPQSIFGGDYAGEGSEMALRDEAGNTLMGVQPDFDGTGGFLWVQSGNFSNAFAVDGNYAGTGSPRISMYGNNSSVIFDLEQTENSAAQLPLSSVASAEILNEPGIATIKANETSPYNLTTALATIASRSITVPAAGYVVVVSSAEIDLNHTAGSSQFCSVGISDAAGTLPNNQDISFYLSSTAAAGIHLTSHHNSAVFDVTAGTHTFYLNGSKNSAAADIQVWDVQLTVMYFPTAYGTVDVTNSGTAPLSAIQDNDAPGVSGPSSADLAAERSASIRDNEDRMARELAELRAEIDAIKAQMSENR